MNAKTKTNLLMGAIALYMTLTLSLAGGLYFFEKTDLIHSLLICAMALSAIYILREFGLLDERSNRVFDAKRVLENELHRVGIERALLLGNLVHFFPAFIAGEDSRWKEGQRKTLVVKMPRGMIAFTINEIDSHMLPKLKTLSVDLQKLNLVSDHLALGAPDTAMSLVRIDWLRCFFAERRLLALDNLELRAEEEQILIDLCDGMESDLNEYMISRVYDPTHEEADWAARAATANAQFRKTAGLSVGALT